MTSVSTNGSTRARGVVVSLDPGELIHTETIATRIEKMAAKRGFSDRGHVPEDSPGGRILAVRAEYATAKVTGRFWYIGDDPGRPDLWPDIEVKTCSPSSKVQGLRLRRDHRPAGRYVLTLPRDENSFVAVGWLPYEQLLQARDYGDAWIAKQEELRPIDELVLTENGLQRAQQVLCLHEFSGFICHLRNGHSGNHQLGPVTWSQR